MVDLVNAIKWVSFCCCWTQRETTWYHGVSDKDTRDDLGMVMGYLYLEVENLVDGRMLLYLLILVARELFVP